MNTKNSRKNFNGFRSFYSFFIGFLLLVLSVGDVVGQVNIIPIRTDVSGFTSWTDIDVAGTTYIQLLKATASTESPAMNFNNFTGESLNFRARTFGGTNATENTVTVSISVNNGVSWTVLGTRTPTSTTLTSVSPFDVSGYSGIQVKIKFTVAGTNDGVGVGIDDVDIKGLAVPTYTIFYNGNGNINGTVPTDASSPYTSGSTVTVIGNTGVLEKTGHSFAGWTIASDGTGTVLNSGSTFSISSNTELYAKWTPTSGSNVTFNANGGTGTMAQQNASSATDLTENIFTRSGYTFTGWNTAADGSGTAYVDEQSYSFASDLTLYAQWSPINNTLSFDGNGATGGSMASQTLATDASITLPANTFTRTGYTFAGWSTTAGGAVEYANAVAFTMGATNTTLFAKWTAINYTVTFNGNGSTAGSMSNQTIAAFATANLTTNAFTRTGFTFSGWNSAADGSGTSYADGASYTMGTANAALFAQWVVFVGPCLSENFNSGTRPSGWTDSGASGITYGSNYIDMSVTTGTVTTVSISNPNSLTFNLSRTTNATAKNLNIEVSTTSNSSGFSIVANFDHSNTTSGGTVACTVDLSAFNSSSTVYVRFNKISTTTSPWRIDDVEVFCASPDPVLSVSTPTLTNLNYTVGFGPSAVQTFNVTGTNLDGSDVDLVIGNNDFEISSDNISFSDILTLPAFSGASQPIYVRLKSGLTVNAYADVILIAGGGVALADEPEVSLAGNVTAVITPVITSSLAESVVYGSSVSYQITANNTPTSFGAINLPTGLSINASGLISGTITTTVGTVNTTISATNGAGTDSETLVWTITPKALILSGLSGTNKVYDGTPAATLSGTGTLTGIVGVDAVTLSGTPTGNFGDKNVGTNKSITVSGYTLSGAQAGNYTLTQPIGLTANITQKSVTVTGATAQDKVYNTTTAATISGATLVGIIGSDAVTVSGSGTFASPNAGTGIAVTAALSLSGLDAGNYTLTQPSGLSANITKANPVFTTSPIAVTVGGTYNLPGANVSSTSDGALSYTITAGGNATLAGATITGAVVGTETLTVNQAASTNYNAGSTTVVVNVTTITYNHGDFRTLTVGKWSYNTTPPADATQWERYNSAIPGWEVYSGQPPKTVVHKAYVTKNTEIPTNATPNGNSIVIVMKDPITNIAPTLTFNCSNEWTFKGLRLEEGSTVQMNAKFSINSGDEFEIKDGATFVFNYGSNGNPASGLGLWNGVEKFHPTSNFRVTDHTSVSSEFFLPPASSFSSNAFSGVTAYFGNLKFESVDEVFLTTTNLSSSTIYLTHSDFEIISPVNYRFIHGNGTWIVGRDLKISGPLTITTGANTINLECKRDFIKESSSVFRLVNNPTGNVTLTVNGDTHINSGSVDLNLQNGGTGTVNMKGDFTVATGATYTASQSSTATTIFSGGNIQDVSGAGTMNVFYMEVNKTGGRVNLQRNLQAKINLKMIQGHVYTNANIFELGESTTQKGTLTYTSGYVVGKMRRWFAGTNSGTSTGLFPMGVDESGLKNRFSLIEYTTGPVTGGHLTVEFILSPMLSASEIQSFLIPAVNSGGFGYDVTSVEDQGYWKIDNQAGTLTDGAYSISCTGEGFETITDLAQVTLLKRVGAGAWFCPGNHEASSGSTAIPTVRRSGVVGYSNFGFGAPMVVNPLPVELTKFEASCSSDGILVSWETASEKNASHFDLETSIDGETWNRITSVSAVGNSTQTQQYAFNDVVRASIQYYRLSQVDLNGATEMYQPIAAQCEMNTNVLVYPNPVQGQLQLLNLGKNGATISISTTDGRIVYTSSTDQNFVQISTENFESGTYFVHIRLSDGTTVLEKVLKQ